MACECEICGDPATTVHRLNGDVLNNTPDNLEILCPECLQRQEYEEEVDTMHIAVEFDLDIADVPRGALSLVRAATRLAFREARKILTTAKMYYPSKFRRILEEQIDDEFERLERDYGPKYRDRRAQLRRNNE